MTGRVIDALGKPIARGGVVVELDQPGVRAEPLTAATDCYGVFITAFTLRNVLPQGKVTVTVKGQGAPDAVAEANLDPYYRRSDLKIRYQGEWGDGCPAQAGLWQNRVTVTGRILSRTEPFEANGMTYHATPYEGRAQLWYWSDNETATCTPSPADATRCDFRGGQTDERGDFRYSWVFERSFEVDADDFVQVVVGNQSWNLTIDPEWRIASGLIDTTGRGPPPLQETPAAPLGVVAVALVAAALAFRRPRA